TGQQVGRELDTAELAADGPRERLHEERLPQARMVLEEDVAVRERAREKLAEERALAHERLRDAVEDPRAGRIEGLGQVRGSIALRRRRASRSPAAPVASVHS